MAKRGKSGRDGCARRIQVWRWYTRHAAGIDVGNGAHYVAVRPERDATPVRRFECFTADPYRLADWLKSCGVKTVAVQSTGVYWIPLYDVLEERGLEVYPVNARHTKNLPFLIYGPQDPVVGRERWPSADRIRASYFRFIEPPLARARYC